MRRIIGSRPVYFAVMAVFTVIYAFPLLWMIGSTFKDNGAIFRDPLGLPERIDFSGWVEAWRVGNLGRYAFNSFFVTMGSVLIILVFASLAAYALSQFKFFGRGFILVIFGIGLLIPIQSYFIAQNELFEMLSLKGHRWTLIIPYAALGLPLAVYLLKVYLDALPRELFEAAKVDGCSDLRLLRSVVTPLLRPGLATVAIFSALASWNEFLLALIYVSNDDHKTIPTGLVAFSSRFVTDYRLLFSALTIATLPMILLYAVFHRQIVAGITDGSLK